MLAGPGHPFFLVLKTLMFSPTPPHPFCFLGCKGCWGLTVSGLRYLFIIHAITAAQVVEGVKLRSLSD